MHLLIRADAGESMGTGHVMRCLALAEVLRDCGHTVGFVCRAMPDAIRARIEQEGCNVLMIAKSDVEETIAHAKHTATEWIIVDGYQFDAAYQKDLKAAGFNMLFLDDFGHAKHYGADFVLNQNVYAIDGLYSARDPETHLLLGPRFALLRREFRRFQGWKRQINEEPTNILVTFGGSDPKNATGKVMSALSTIKQSLNVTVVLGGSNPHAEEIMRIARDMQNVTILRNSPDMPQLMQEADLALCGGGTTCYEMAFLQLPMLTLVLAENQAENARALQEAGCSVNLGTIEDFDSGMFADTFMHLLGDLQKRTVMGEHSRMLVDGEGAERVAMQLTGHRLRLRKTRMEDCELVFAWANDPDTRKASFSSEQITWEDHVAWFQKSLSNPNRIFFIAVDTEDTPVGYIRFDREGAEATLSIAIAPGQRNAGFGSELVSLGTKKLFATTECEVIRAFVKPENAASGRLFQKTGFEELAPLEGDPARHFVLKRGIIGA